MNHNDIESRKNLEAYFNNSTDKIIEKLSNFTKYVPRQDLTNFLCKYEIFKKILNVEGNIVECGVRYGGGLMTFAQLSSIFEPVNFKRKIIGFDTFSGIPHLTKKDSGATSSEARKGGMAVNSLQDLKTCIKLYDMNRSIPDIPKVELVKGDAVHTIPQYLRKNPHTVVSLLYLDFDVYMPTKIALENFVPRMPKGAIIVFDELNIKSWVGETRALMDTIGINNLQIERFSFHPHIAYAILR